MIEMTLIYDLQPHLDKPEYGSWIKRFVNTLRKTPGMLKLHLQRNQLGMPNTRVTIAWKCLEDWAAFFDSEAWEELEVELREKFVSNLRVDLWGSSPILPKAIRP